MATQTIVVWDTHEYWLSAEELNEIEEMTNHFNDGPNHSLEFDAEMSDEQIENWLWENRWEE